MVTALDRLYKIFNGDEPIGIFGVNSPRTQTDRLVEYVVRQMNLVYRPTGQEEDIQTISDGFVTSDRR